MSSATATPSLHEKRRRLFRMRCRLGLAWAGFVLFAIIVCLAAAVLCFAVAWLLQMLVADIPLLRDFLRVPRSF